MSTGTEVGGSSRHGASMAESSCSFRPPLNVSDGERILSIAGGAALAVWALTRMPLRGFVAIGAAAGLLYRGFTGRCHAYAALDLDTRHGGEASSVPAQAGVKIEQSIAIQRSPAELYQQWRNLDQLKEFPAGLEGFERLSDRCSRWTFRGPLGQPVHWDVEIFNEKENEMIAWRSLPSSDVETAGSIHFETLGEGQPTLVWLSMKYNPPAGKLGAALEWLTGESLSKQIAADLRKFKNHMETGMPSLQSSGSA